MGRGRGRKACRFAAAGLSAVAFGLSGQSAAAAQAPANLNGYWLLAPESQRALPAPPLTDWGREQVEPVAKLVKDVERWCLVAGVPTVMRGPRPIGILQGRTETAILPEVRGSARHIYTTVTAHPNPDTYDPTPAGHSIGRWDGAVFVVETNGFNAGVGPAGAPRTETTTLVERFRITGPGRLVIESSWTDPEVFMRPYTYSQTYLRLPDGYNAGESFCDPRDRVPTGTE